MSERSRRYADEALGLLLVVAALLTALALFSHSPQDPVPFFSSTSGENARAANWIGGFGAMWSTVLLAVFGLSAWLLVAGLAAWGVQRFSAKRFVNPGTKAVGILLLALSLPALLAIVLGDRDFRGETLHSGGLLGSGIAGFVRARFNTPGSIILLSAVFLLSIPLSTQVSLGEALFHLKLRAIALFGRFRLGFTRRRERQMKERLKRIVVQKHIEKSRQEEPVDDAAFGEERGPVKVRKLEGEGKFSIRKVAAPPPAAPPAPGREKEKPREKKRPSPQRALPIEMGGYLYPQSSLLQKYDPVGSFDRKQLPEIARRITEKCAEFGVEGEVVEFHPGPVVTTYEFRPAAGIKVTQVMSMSEDLALALSAEAIRIERIPGRSSVGIEVPNPDGGDLIALRDVIESERFAAERSLLALALGKDIHGEPVVQNLQSMPHLLIAGTTGSGKSVGINTIITSLLFKATPAQVKLILIDPKMVELEIYRDIPHLLTPIVTDPKKASNALKWAVAQMEERYQLLSKVGNVRNIDQYNRAVEDKQTVAEVKARLGDEAEDLELAPLPYIVLIIDELADLMMTAPKDVEESIARIAQKARAVGIHLVVATQRPSTDVLTGVIKANLPSRIAFKVATKIDSRVVLDGNGAEKLLGRGDMLYLGPGTSRLHRVHGAFISVQETAALVKFLKKQAKPVFDEEITKDREEEARIAGVGGGKGEESDPLYDEAARLVVKERMASISFLQRRMGVGFSRAGKLIDMMDKDGLLGPQKGSKPREVLVPADYFDGVDQQAR
ncbi:MAG TPA: DNA translocase FtsK 4TM domain-containing protein [Thermoanaerobaculia bacterium]|nr:DNA translocase FtsK 4TM domain-containing protein [Thermoanaerobaculia bacterium]